MGYMPRTQPRHHEFPLDWTKIKVSIPIYYLGGQFKDVTLRHGASDDPAHVAKQHCLYNDPTYAACMSWLTEFIRNTTQLWIRRAVFVASRKPLRVEPDGALVEGVPMQQVPCCQAS